MTDDPAAPLSQVQETIETLLETIRKTIVVVEDFQPESQPVLNANLNRMVEQLQQLEDKKQLHDVDIPLDIFDFVDRGRNPDLFTKQSAELVMQRSQATKGKVDALQAFKDALETELKTKTT
eukprot:TRINITY_DN26087_c0_g1_i1.p2 TRINITY_DN26087_c0_g1~~TRINITY_DN26087_c0_g1_i1.p2  ORF type:complete len:122 (-),score=46.74 TRINITY_DN26087_c0_g1_i1:226-591(-)